MKLLVSSASPAVMAGWNWFRVCKNYPSFPYFYTCVELKGELPFERGIKRCIAWVEKRKKKRKKEMESMNHRSKKVAQSTFVASAQSCAKKIPST